MRILALMCLMLLLCSAASAETKTQIWRETIAAYGREIAIDVTVQVPDGDELGIYRVSTISAEASKGEYPHRVQPQKRRGIAYRTKLEEPVAYADIDRAYHAYGNPVSAGEALDTVQAFLAPVLSRVQGVEMTLDSMTIYTPRFIYYKDSGEWGEQIHADETGGYAFTSSYWLDGLEIAPREYPQWRDDRKLTFGTPYPKSAYWSCYLSVNENGYQHMSISIPTVIAKTSDSIELAPLEATKDSLRALAKQGMLRSIKSMQLAYAEFDCGEEEVWELRPVWMTVAEIYPDETRSAENYGYEPWYETIITDARTGEIIEMCWADGYRPYPAE